MLRHSLHPYRAIRRKSSAAASPFAGASIAAAPMIAVSLLSPEDQQSFAALLVGFALSEAWRAPAAIMVRDVSPARLGSTASAIHLCFRNLIGGLGPLGACSPVCVVRCLHGGLPQLLCARRHVAKKLAADVWLAPAFPVLLPFDSVGCELPPELCGADSREPAKVAGRRTMISLLRRCTKVGLLIISCCSAQRWHG